MTATSTGERIHMDVSGSFPPTLGGFRYWVMFKDQYSGMAWNVFTPNKDKVYEITKENFYYIAGLKNKMRFVRCDNAGKYGKIELLCHNFGLTMEYTAPYTPQKNGVVERQFATDLRRSQSMMETADLTEGLRKLLRNKAIMTATTKSNISCNDITNKLSPYQKFYGKSPLLKMEHLVQFGRLGYVTHRRKIKCKLASKVIKCLFVGYAFNHSAHTYRMYNPRARHIILSRDVRWDKWNTKDPKETLRENRQVYMQSLVNQNSNGWSDHQTQQFNKFLDHYLHPPPHLPLPDMPEILDYAAYDLISEDGSHLLAVPLNEEEEPPQFQNFNLENQDEEVEVQEIEDEEEKTVPLQDQEEEEHEELDIVEDSDEEEQTRSTLRDNRELRNLGVIPRT
jgi:hypothetical protein